MAPIERVDQLAWQRGQAGGFATHPGAETRAIGRP